MSDEPHRQTRFENPPDALLLEIQGQVQDIWQLLNGKDGALGLSQKMAVVWRAHVFLVYGLGTLTGSVITAMVLKGLGLLR